MTPADTRRAWRSGIARSLTNPPNVAYWAAIGSALALVPLRDLWQSTRDLRGAPAEPSTLVLEDIHAA